MPVRLRAVSRAGGAALMVTLGVSSGLLVAAAPPPVTTRYLLVGGGTDPSNTQISLEEHVRRLGKLLVDRGVMRARLTTLFAAGTGPRPIVEQLIGERPPTPLLDMLASVMGRTEDRQVTWRAVSLPDVAGPANGESFKEQLKATGDAGRTVWYQAGHGFRASNNTPVTMGLWGQKVSARELSVWLDELPPSHQVVMVMAQCYSGAFGEALYRGAEVARGLADHDRCGFYAAPPDKVSSGCTPEANREKPDDYSTWFFSALAGQLPTGEPLPERPDLDGNGKVTLEEAHAFARVHDGTLDVPTSSSEFFLRTHVPSLSEKSVVLEKETKGKSIVKAAPVGEEAPLGTLLAAARLPEKSVLQALAARQGVSLDPSPILSARQQLVRLSGKLKGIEKRSSEVVERRDRLRVRIREPLLEQWPWLRNPYHPEHAQVLSQHEAELTAFISGRPEWKDIQAANKELSGLNREKAGLQTDIAQLERFIRAGEQVVMRSRLLAADAPELQGQLNRLLACEGGTL